MSKQTANPVEKPKKRGESGPPMVGVTWTALGFVRRQSRISPT